MSWEANRHYSWRKWKDCERCGLPWPEEELVLQKGVLVCPECYDEKDHADYIRDANPVEPKLPKVWDSDE